MGRIADDGKHSYRVPQYHFDNKKLLPEEYFEDGFQIQLEANFDGIIDYSLDVNHLIDVCDTRRVKKDYFITKNKVYYCKAFVIISFGPDTIKLRKQFYREEGFNITYSPEETIYYVRYKRTAAGAREGRCLFIARDFYEEMMKWSNVFTDNRPGAKNDIQGIISTIKQADAVGWEAYSALTLSAIENTMEIDPTQILFVNSLSAENKAAVTGKKVNEIYIDSDGHLQSRRRQSGTADNDGTVKIINDIWDGEGLIDFSCFPEDPTLKSLYSDKHMLYLRGKFF